MGVMPNGDVITGSSTKALCIWDKDDFHLKDTILGAHDDLIRCIKPLPGDPKDEGFITCSNDNTLKCWKNRKPFSVL